MEYKERLCPAAPAPATPSAEDPRRCPGRPKKDLRPPAAPPALPASPSAALSAAGGAASAPRWQGRPRKQANYHSFYGVMFLVLIDAWVLCGYGEGTVIFFYCCPADCNDIDRIACPLT